MCGPRGAGGSVPAGRGGNGWVKEGVFMDEEKVPVFLFPRDVEQQEYFYERLDHGFLSNDFGRSYRFTAHPLKDLKVGIWVQ